MMNSSFFLDVFTKSISIKRRFIEENTDALFDIALVFCQQLSSGKKILLFGNGGSAADAQHLTAELINRLVLSDRPAIPALSLTTDTSNLTSIANDRSFDLIFSRQIEAFGVPGDIALGISTSGNSPNVIEGMLAAKKLKMITIGFLGGNGGRLADLVDFSLVVPSTSAQRIQETHITIGHALCEFIEMRLFN